MLTQSNQYSGSAPGHPASLLLTGCYRSGTSLLEKLLHMQPRVCLASQPFPALYFHFKNAFHRRRGLTRRYPLDHLFLERDYLRRDLHEFLDQHRISNTDLRDVFLDLEGYPGWGTPELGAKRDQIHPGRFLEVYTELNHTLAQIFGKQEVQYVGGKEVLVEEYVPYLISHGSRVVIIIRDPRDMITSLNFRQRASLTGNIRPILYSLRVWRKSVAIALACEDDPNLLWLRYEDLVRQPEETLTRLTNRLQLPPPDLQLLAQGIPDQSGQTWVGNSSFEQWKGVSPQSVGRFESILPEPVVEYIEACCMAEMKSLDYALSGRGVFSPQALHDFREPLPVDHVRFVSGYGEAPQHIEQELERHRRLQSNSEDGVLEELERWFIHPTAYFKLRKACA